jgi:adenylate kinase
LKEVQERILEEFAYQSSLELDNTSHERIRRIPLASDLVKHARQELVRRINSYEKNQSKLFEKVIHAIEHHFIPIVSKHAMTGWAFINSEDTLFNDPVALEMLIDVFSERGYFATVDIRKNELPVRIENNTIVSERKKVYRFQIRFQGYALQRI